MNLFKSSSRRFHLELYVLYDIKQNKIMLLIRRPYNCCFLIWMSWSVTGTSFQLVFTTEYIWSKECIGEEILKYQYGHVTIFLSLTLLVYKSLFYTWNYFLNTPIYKSPICLRLELYGTKDESVGDPTLKKKITF